MKRPLRPEEVKLWTTVARTVRPAHGRVLPVAPEEEAPVTDRKRGASVPQPAAAAIPRPAAPSRRPTVRALTEIAPDPIEPGRKRRISRERDPIEARVDLHGLTQFAAEDRLKAFLIRAQEIGVRAVLVITGKGTRGDGVIRRRTPDWLADPVLREVVAGVSPAHARHGGEGALYVAIKRKAAR
jgi:DNA-nicking Smr family endonuclease